MWSPISVPNDCPARDAPRTSHSRKQQACQLRFVCQQTVLPPVFGNGQRTNTLIWCARGRAVRLAVASLIAEIPEQWQAI